jgi:hypothetical protein
LVLVLVGIAGFVLGTYGVASGIAQDTASVLTGTDTTTAADTATEATTATDTTVPTEATTTNPAVTTETHTTTVIAPPPTTAAETSSSSTPWGWIALGLGLAALLLVGLALWLRHRAGTATWRKKAANLNRRCLVAMDEVLDKGSVVTGQIEALAVEARSLVKGAPDDAAKASTADVSARLEDLAQALEADRRLRLGSPPPSAEQLSYSTSVIRQQVGQLQSALRQQSAAPKP